MHLCCPHCQNPIELADVPSSGDITCAGCGSSFQIAGATTAAWAKPERKRIGNFEIIGTLGQGAFGTVFKAHDSELDRTVAIKVPRAGNIGSGPEDVNRFLREARAVAQLRFPSILTIHEVGTDNGTPYLVSDFVEGLTLADVLTGRRFPVRESAKLIAEVADALQYAHALGVIHRDVKPSNIMIRPDGSPCVMDFGLAKRDAGEITMTMDGQILGTPAYMSPEQARGEGHTVDGRSDVYSLGVVLYQLLIGELPFRGNKAMLLHQVLHDEPKPPRSLNDKIPRDLETIALKAMAKEPGRRYANAQALADDLRRWLTGEPILARPVGAVERTWRWCKRKPALATASAVAILGVLLALGTFAGAFIMVSESLENETNERKKAEQLAEHNKKLADDNGRLAGEQKKLADANAQLAAKETKAREEADDRRERAEELALRISFEHFAGQVQERKDLALVGTAQLLSSATKLKSRALYNSMLLHLGKWASERNAGDPPGVPRQHHAVLQHYHGVVCAALSADGRVGITGSWDKTAKIWFTASGHVGIGPTLQHENNVEPVALSADGKIALTGSHDNTARLWQTTTGNLIGSPQRQALFPALSADGRTAIFCRDDKSVQLWDTATGNLTRLLPTRRARCVALSADGKIALTGSDDGTAQVWDTTTSKPVGSPLKWANNVAAVALSADGGAALARSSKVRLWETATGKPIGLPIGHYGPAQCMALSGNGAMFISGSHDNSARLWDARTGLPVGPALKHPDLVLAVAISNDGFVAATASRDKTARLWETATGKQIGLPIQHLDVVRAAALSADGKTVLTASQDKTAQLWKLVRFADDPARIAVWAQALTGIEVDGQGNALILTDVDWQQRKARLQKLGGSPLLD